MHLIFLEKVKRVQTPLAGLGNKLELMNVRSGGQFVTNEK